MLASHLGSPWLAWNSSVAEDYLNFLTLPASAFQVLGL